MTKAGLGRFRGGASSGGPGSRVPGPAFRFRRPGGPGPFVTCPAIVGAEALVRWNYPARGLLAPSAFIHIAEELGAVVDLRRWVLRPVCADARERLLAGRVTSAPAR